MNQAPVLLTGATGFIGRRIQRTLLNAGVPVRAIVRSGSRHRAHTDPRSELVECNLTDPESLSRAVEGIAAVVYCAGSVRGRMLDDFLPANVEGVKAVIQAQVAAGSTSPFLLISSLAASRPEISDYAQSKLLGENALRSHAHTAWAIFRPPAVYGPGDTEMLPLLKMARRGLLPRIGPPNQRLSLLYADDLAAAVLAWLGAWRECAEQTFALDDGQRGGYSWPAIAQSASNSSVFTLAVPRALLAAVARMNLLISRLAGYAPMLTPGKVREITQPDWLCDNSAYTQATGWQPQTGLPCGIRLSLESTP